MLQKLIARRVWVTGTFLLLAGAILILITAVLLWLPTFTSCTTGGCGGYHYFFESVIIFWVLGALAPVLVLLKVELLGLWIFVPAIVLITVVALIVQIELGDYFVYPIGKTTNQGLVYLLLVLVVGYAAEIAGTVLLPKRPSKAREDVPPSTDPV